MIVGGWEGGGGGGGTSSGFPGGISKTEVDFRFSDGGFGKSESPSTMLTRQYSIKAINTKL